MHRSPLGGSCPRAIAHEVTRLASGFFVRNLAHQEPRGIGPAHLEKSGLRRITNQNPDRIHGPPLVRVVEGWSRDRNDPNSETRTLSRTLGNSQNGMRPVGAAPSSFLPGDRFQPRHDDRGKRPGRRPFSSRTIPQIVFAHHRANRWAGPFGFFTATPKPDPTCPLGWRAKREEHSADRDRHSDCL